MHLRTSATNSDRRGHTQVQCKRRMINREGPIKEVHESHPPTWFLATWSRQLCGDENAKLHFGERGGGRSVGRAQARRSVALPPAPSARQTQPGVCPHTPKALRG